MFANLDKKKKIIIGVVFVAALGILTLIMSLILFPKMKESDDKLIVTPNVDEKLNFLQKSGQISLAPMLRF